MNFSSSWEKTLPVGLLGVFRMMAFVLLLRDRGCAAQETFEAAGGESHAPALLSAFVSPVTDLAAGGGSGSARRIRRVVFPRARSRFAAGSWRGVSSGIAFLQRVGTIAGLASQND